MKNMLRLLILSMAVISFSALPAVAAECELGSKKCPMSESKCKMASHCKAEDKDCDKYKCPITAKIMKKAKFLLHNAKEIGLSDDQVAAIKAIKHDTKKAYMRQCTEMQIFEMDMNAMLSASPLDTDGLNTMVSQAASGWVEGSKSGIATYAKLKAILTDAQKEKAKELWNK